MIYVFTAVGLLVGFIFGLLMRRRPSQSHIGSLHVYQDEFEEPMLFLEISRGSAATLYDKKEVSMSVIFHHEPRE